jgi:hypothetical protein
MPCAEARQFVNDPNSNPVSEGYCEIGKFEGLALRRLLKLFERQGIRYQTATVFHRVPTKRGPITRTVTSIWVHFLEKKRAEAIVHPTLLARNAIRNCKIKLAFVCPRDWDELDPTGESGARFCQQCQQKVFLCKNDFDALERARAGHCIAMPGEDGSARFLLKVGMPPPLTLEQERAYQAYRIDQAKTEALRTLTDSSTFCSVCAYPLPQDSKNCLICAARRSASGLF